MGDEPGETANGSGIDDAVLCADASDDVEFYALQHAHVSVAGESTVPADALRITGSLRTGDVAAVVSRQPARTKSSSSERHSLGRRHVPVFRRQQRWRCCDEPQGEGHAGQQGLPQAPESACHPPDGGVVPPQLQPSVPDERDDRILRARGQHLRRAGQEVDGEQARAFVQHALVQRLDPPEATEAPSEDVADAHDDDSATRHAAARPDRYTRELHGAATLEPVVPGTRRLPVPVGARKRGSGKAMRNPDVAPHVVVGESKEQYPVPASIVNRVRLRQRVVVQGQS